MKFIKERSQISRQDHGWKVHGSGWSTNYVARKLCLDCRRVNAHGADCSRNESSTVYLRNRAEVPSHDASTWRWKQFFAQGVKVYYKPSISPEASVG